MRTACSPLRGGASIVAARLALRCEGRVDRGREAGAVVAASISDAPDEHRRHRVDPELLPLGVLAVDARAGARIGDVRVEPGEVEAELLGSGAEVDGAEAAGPLDQEPVHLDERALPARGLRGDGDRTRV